MKKWLVRVIVAGLLAAVGFWGWRVFFPSPEEVIRKRLGQLARSASTSSSESLLAKAWNASALAEYFTVDVEITLDVPGLQHTINGRDELVRIDAGARSDGRSLTVTFPDIKVLVAPDGQSAVVILTAEGKVSAPKELYVAELKLRMIRIKRDWLIEKAETVKTLSFNAPCLISRQCPATRDAPASQPRADTPVVPPSLLRCPSVLPPIRERRMDGGATEEGRRYYGGISGRVS